RLRALSREQEGQLATRDLGDDAMLAAQRVEQRLARIDAQGEAMLVVRARGAQAERELIEAQVAGLDVCTQTLRRLLQRCWGARREHQKLSAALTRHFVARLRLRRLF